MAIAQFDYLSSEQNKVWLGDCKVTGQTLIFCYGYFAKNTPATVIVWREDDRGYEIKLPPELTMQPYPINFFRRVEFQILNVTMKKNR